MRPSDTATLLELAARGDRWAREQLLDRHRDRLLGMVALRMNSRLQKRFDPTDILQEALVQ